MSLLMLKTKDLSHQDHILNFELMLNPTRSGLLLNKHRSLESKRDKEKEICEVERRFAVNHFQIEKRLIERRRNLLMEQAAKRTYYRATPVASRSASISIPESEDLGEEMDSWDDMPRTKSAPLGRGKDKLGVRGSKIGVFHGSSKKTRPNTARNRRETPSVAMDQRPQTTATGRQGKKFQPTPSPSTRHSEPQRLFSGKSQSVFNRRSTAFMPFVSDTASSKVPQPNMHNQGNVWAANAKTNTNTSSSTSTNSKTTNVTFLTQTDTNRLKTAFADLPDQEQQSAKTETDDNSHKNRSVTTALQNEENNSTIIKGRVGEFLTKVEDFKTRPLSRDIEARENSPWMVQPPNRTSSATVAKRYDQLSLDIEKLHSAFDKLCVQRNPEELQKIVKLASKLKSNVKYARNVSFVPVMATLKGGKRFRQNAVSTH